VEIHTLIPQEAHVRSQLLAIPPDPSRTYAAQHLDCDISGGAAHASGLAGSSKLVV
jgi:hypothetical protein